MSTESLQQRIDAAGGALRMLRDSQLGPYVFPVKAEFSNWHEEQRAWRESVALLDLSLHMTDLYIEGPDAYRFVSEFGANNFRGFGPGRAKQYIACAPSGHLIGDMIIVGLSDQMLNVVGRPTVASWLEYNAEAGKYNVRIERDERTVSNPKPRKIFRYQIQGPAAWKLIEKLNGSALPSLRLFQVSVIKIRDREYRFLRHGMGGAPGGEVSGPLEFGPEVEATILEAGEEFGIKRVGGRAYGSSVVDSGWIPCPLPAIYSGSENRPYREWLSGASYEGIASLGGSLVTDRIEDYYFTPWELDYGRLVQFDHDFVGRSALESMVKRPHRRKVSIVWDPDDVAAVYRSQMNESNGKWMEAPLAHYSSYPYDEVVNDKGDRVGVSTYVAFLAPDHAWVSLAVVDEEYSKPGTQLSVVWGEPKGSRRPMVERHVQMTVRGSVATWPFSSLARQDYRVNQR
jgi:syringate O-demethylase/vanillate/3-O-methylgallate O-demethylase